MVIPDNQEFPNVDNSAIASEESSRLLLADRMLLDRKNLFILQQATQTSAEFLEIPVCMVGGIQTNQRLKQIAVSFFETELEDIEKLQELANKLPEFSGDDALWQEVFASQEVVAIRDPMTEIKWAESIWIKKYGIRAFLGVPLLDDNGHCLGVLMAMDLSPRRFTRKEIQFLELTARWTMSELNRIELGKSAASLTNGLPETSLPQVSSSNVAPLNESNVLNQGDTRSDYISWVLVEKLIGIMTQEMRNPLTSVTGMARVLNQEVYGKLNEKQKEYLNIIYDSGRYLVSLLDELVFLRSLDDQTSGLTIAFVDIEMLCQQVMNHLELEAQRRGQELRLSVEPGDRLVLLDKSKVYQILYHLLARVIETADPGGVVRLHVSRKTDILKMTIWVSHPWLGEGLNPMETFDLNCPNPLMNESSDRSNFLARQMAIENILSSKFDLNTIQTINNLMSGFKTPDSREYELETGDAKSEIKLSRQDLGILLSWQLSRQHEGQIYLEGSDNYGYRYLIELPLMSELDSRN